MLLFFQCLILLIVATPVFAHDPGLSYVNLEERHDRLVVSAVFAETEARSLDLGQAIEIAIDGVRIEPLTFTVTSDEIGAIRISYEFQRVARGRVEFRSTMLEKLAPGHRQYVTYEGQSHLLNSKNNFVTLDVGRSTFGPLIWMGAEHIWFGFDHLAFLFALLVAVHSFREVLKIITAFTIAHSITLTAASLDLVRLPGGLVEPVIALSIVYVGIENLFGRPRMSRAIVTFAFGLVHGFGFASALKDLGVGRDSPAAILAFNLGVEFGQIAIAALVLPVLWKLRDIPGSLYLQISSAVIVVAGTWWLFERVVLN